MESHSMEKGTKARPSRKKKVEHPTNVDEVLEKLPRERGKIFQVAQITYSGMEQ
jgi:hypothetical protein